RAAHRRRTPQRVRLDDSSLAVCHGDDGTRTHQPGNDARDKRHEARLTMITRLTMIRFALVLLGFASTAAAQVIAMREPHHHPVFEDGAIRVLRVRVPAGDSTLLHQHDPDYFWIALGQSSIVSAKLGEAETKLSALDLSIHY